MKVVLSTAFQAHTFNIAKELIRRQTLSQLFTGYPRARMAAKGITGPSLVTHPLPLVSFQIATRIIKSQAFSLWGEAPPKVAFDLWVSRHLNKCDVFVGTSSVGLASGRVAKSRGAFWVCDRPSSHILEQNELLTTEFALHELRWPGISQQIIERELAEYDEADAILVGSNFAADSFLSRGVPSSKVWVIPYGADMNLFRPDGSPRSDGFDILFAGRKSLRKGVPYLLEAFELVDHPNKTLTIVGPESDETAALMRRASQVAGIRVLATVPQSELPKLMSRSHVLALPSIEEGFALVMLQALACGCPIIASVNTGALDIIEKGRCGTVVPIRQPAAIAAAMQDVADNPMLREQMSSAALSVAKQFLGWDSYCDSLVERLITAGVSR